MLVIRTIGPDEGSYAGTTSFDRVEEASGMAKRRAPGSIQMSKSQNAPCVPVKCDEGRLAIDWARSRYEAPGSQILGPALLCFGFRDAGSEFGNFVR